MKLLIIIGVVVAGRWAYRRAMNEREAAIRLHPSTVDRLMDDGRGSDRGWAFTALNP